MSEAAAAKDYWRTHHLQGSQLIREGHEHRWALAEHIARHEPISILEFGCSSGRNLAVLREVLGPDVELTGVDMNETTLGRAREAHPDMTFLLDDETVLEWWPDGHFDVVFTSSVLDHIPDPEWRHVYSQLVRLARKAVVLYEPVKAEGGADPGAGRAVVGECADLGIPAPRFTWLHDYFSEDPRLRFVKWILVDQATEYVEFGRLYGLMERVK